MNSQQLALDHTSCDASCAAGTYDNTASQTTTAGRTCAACMANCIGCSSANACDVCSNSKYLKADKTSCLDYCPYGEMPGEKGEYFDGVQILDSTTNT
jgi:hypothetical protein